MDYVMKAKDLKAMKYSSCYKDIQVVMYNLIFSSLVAITCSFLCSYSFWFSSLKYLALISLPSFWSSFLNPKFLFVVFNVIVAYLVGESKLFGTPKPSPANEIYAEYVERTRNLRRQRKYFHEEGKEEEKRMEISTKECDETKVCEDKEIVMVEQQVDKDQEKVEDQGDEEFQEAKNDYDDDEDEYEDEDEKKEEKIIGEEVESGEFPTEELNRRVEDFIARINKQRWIEARMLI